PEVARHRNREAEEIANLRARDEHRDPVREADDDRPRDELDRVPHARRAEYDEQRARHHRAHEQAVDAVVRDDAGHDDDERAGRPCDLEARAAERRDEEAGDDRAVEARLRQHARRDCERHRERERDEADGDAGAAIVGLGQHVDYWDGIGWNDRFSSAAYKNRQQTYGARFNLESVYTPQIVVDGRAQLVGSDDGAARSEIEHAAQSPHGSVQIDV